jgi:hypothetical protein
MSLDVYLEGNDPRPERWAIFIREDGQKKEISLEEWNRRHPGRKPCLAKVGGDTELYNGNVTHNLTDMAREAGLYELLWHPEEVGIERGEQLVAPLSEGLERLRADPERFKEHNPSNGWGDYDVFVTFVAEYLDACSRHPEANVRVWR